MDLVLADEQLPNGGIGLTSVSTTTGNVLWPLFDQLGSVRDVVDSNGVIRQHLVFDSFGNRLSETDYNTSGAVIPSSDPAAVDELFGYTGREWDSDVKLQYNRVRWYDPAQGRWLSQDPIGFAAGDVNWYRYVGNQPTVYRDPSGELWSLILTGGFAVWDTAMVATGQISGKEYAVRMAVNGVAFAADVASAGMGGGLAGWRLVRQRRE